MITCAAASTSSEEPSITRTKTTTLSLISSMFPVTMASVPNLRATSSALHAIM